MDLMEYKARELFENAGIPVLKGFTVSSVDELDINIPISFPAVVKAQVQTGGRGKLGGIQFANTPSELKEVTSKILGMDIKGHTVEKVMITQKADITCELYLSIMLDRNSKKHIIILSPCGGMEIEQTAKTTPEKIFKIEIDPLLGLSKPTACYLAAKAHLIGEQTKQLISLLSLLYQFCLDYDCMLVEINPLAIDRQGQLFALDAKVSIDDSGLERLPDIKAFRDSLPVAPLIRQARDYNFLYIPCDDQGDIVVMSNGSGMLMSCIDHITQRGKTVSAVLDLGGGATGERICQAIRILAATKNTALLFINIFGGITRCDEVAMGIKSAVEDHHINLPVVVRFEGTNKEAGLKIISGLKNVVYVDGLQSGVEEIVKRGMHQ